MHDLHRRRKLWAQRLLRTVISHSLQHNWTSWTVPRYNTHRTHHEAHSSLHLHIIHTNSFTHTLTHQERNEAYNRTAPDLAVAAAEKALRDWGGDRSEISHVISVSCTGTAVPGLEFLLVERLKLRDSVQRLGVNFMGCFGGLAGLRTAEGKVSRVHTSSHSNTHSLILTHPRTYTPF